jgi:membrane protein CcdC involved in cytochrome C biogenesis
VPCILKLQKYFEIQEKKIELQSKCFRLDKNSLLIVKRIKKDFVSTSNLTTLDGNFILF